MSKRLAKFSVVPVSLVCALALPALAGADTSTSQNWSGYAAHAAGLSFRKLSGSWKQPGAACTQGERTYSAFWVGLGGYSLNSDGLEQIGTEDDCAADGSEDLYAWYELVPAPPQPIRMTVKPGDLLSASVHVLGAEVTLTLEDQTRHRSFAKTLTDHSIDVSSAEWIAEAPSECFSSTQCRTLPLADYGSLQFSGASAQTTGGRTGAISSLLWDATKIVLSSSGSQLVSHGASVSAGGAQSTPAALTSAGSAFAVTYSDAAAGQPRSYNGGGGYGGGRPPSYGSRGPTSHSGPELSRRLNRES
ncbi:MAG: G1 family glutamic endopeptidase [Solirubrobacteraceae bacterium]